MIHKLWDKHVDSTVAVIGSGPSATMYNGQGDISIAVNGAALLGRRFTYYMVGDSLSFSYDWFDIDCSDIRIIARIVAGKDYKLYPADMAVNRVAVQAHKQHIVSDLPDPVPPHLIYNYAAYDPKGLHKGMNSLMRGGTIACCAVQIAYLMGASKILLFGCPFTHSNGDYFYESSRIGSICMSQRATMDDVLAIIRREEVAVSVYGPTTLSEHDDSF